MRILIAEDEKMLLEGLVDLCEAAGHEVTAAKNGLDAVKFAESQSFDVFVLDVMMPGLNGIDVLKRIRVLWPDVPVLMLTALGDEVDKVKGLKAGADDYVTKPFGPKELLARLEALFRRYQALPKEPELIKAFDCQIDLGKLIVTTTEKEETSLTPREAGLIRWLFRHRGRAVSRQELLERLWNAPGSLKTRTVDMTVANLRQKLESDPANPKIIISVTGVGYTWVTE